MTPVGGNGVDYSVWNERTLRYDYYRSPRRLRAGVIAPAPRMGQHRLGLTPEEATRRLPPGARRVGSGEQARGIIATSRMPTAMGGLMGLETATLMRVAVVGLVGYIIYKRRSK